MSKQRVFNSVYKPSPFSILLPHQWIRYIYSTPNIHCVLAISIRKNKQHNIVEKILMLCKQKTRQEFETYAKVACCIKKHDGSWTISNEEGLVTQMTETHFPENAKDE